MDRTKVIEIQLQGPVQSGKSSVMQSIKGMLEDYGYCVSIPNREERNDPADPLSNAASHEKPSKDDTVIILSEK